jgi:CubicO group peptidase (beta-lactamase class C family)
LQGTSVDAMIEQIAWFVRPGAEDMSRMIPPVAWMVLLAVVPSTPGAEPDVRPKLAELMEVRAKGGFSGSVLVAREGEILLRRGYGMANAEHEVANTPETKFRIGSVTKQFTAAAILILQEQGKLDVHRPIKSYLSDCTEAWDTITVQNLLTHTSGIPDYTRLPGRERRIRDPATPDALIALFRDRPLEFKPGLRFAYSNSGYAVLGRIIERVSGKTYAEFLSEQIFNPLGMTDSGYDDARTVLKGRAAGYARRSSTLQNAAYLDMTNPFSAGGLYSTVDDLLKWDRALTANRLVSNESQLAMFTPYLQNYGYGWRVAFTFDRPMVAHAGSINGFSSHIRRYPAEDRVCIIVLSNVEGAPAVEIGGELAAVVFEKSPAPDRRQAP